MSLKPFWPQFGVHASAEGVVGEGVANRAQVVCAAADGGRKNTPGHGHNFHIIEHTGDLVTIFVARRLLGGDVAAAARADGAEPEAFDRLADEQARRVHYEVWYVVDRRAEPATGGKAGNRAAPAKKKKRMTKADVARFDEAAFFGGDGITVDPKKFEAHRASIRKSEAAMGAPAVVPGGAGAGGTSGEPPLGAPSAKGEASGDSGISEL